MGSVLWLTEPTNRINRVILVSEKQEPKFFVLILSVLVRGYFCLVLGFWLNLPWANRRPQRRGRKEMEGLVLKGPAAQA